MVIVKPFLQLTCTSFKTGSSPSQRRYEFCRDVSCLFPPAMREDEVFLIISYLAFHTIEIRLNMKYNYEDFSPYLFHFIPSMCQIFSLFLMYWLQVI